MKRATHTARVALAHWNRQMSFVIGLVARNPQDLNRTPLTLKGLSAHWRPSGDFP